MQNNEHALDKIPMPLDKQEVSDIIIAIECKIDWINRYAPDCFFSLEEANNLKKLIVKLERIYDEFMID